MIPTKAIAVSAALTQAVNTAEQRFDLALMQPVSLERCVALAGIIGYLQGEMKQAAKALRNLD